MKRLFLTAIIFSFATLAIQAQVRQSQEIEVEEAPVFLDQTIEIEEAPAPPPPPPPPPPRPYREKRNVTDSDEVFKVVETMPQFPGCQEEDSRAQSACSRKKMMEYISNHPSYKAEAKRGVANGTSVVRFIVQKDGSIANAELLRALGDQTTQDNMLAIINDMPNWKPGKQRGQVVDVSYNVPIKIKPAAQKK